MEPTYGEVARVIVALGAVESAAIAGPLLAIAIAIAGLAIQLRNARTQIEPTILKIGHDALIEANAALLRERNEARENRDYWKGRARECEGARLVE